MADIAHSVPERVQAFLASWERQWRLVKSVLRVLVAGVPVSGALFVYGKHAFDGWSAVPLALGAAAVLFILCLATRRAVLAIEMRSIRNGFLSAFPAGKAGHAEARALLGDLMNSKLAADLHWHLPGGGTKGPKPKAAKIKAPKSANATHQKMAADNTAQTSDLAPPEVDYKPQLLEPAAPDAAMGPSTVPITPKVKGDGFKKKPPQPELVARRAPPTPTYIPLDPYASGDDASTAD